MTPPRTSGVRKSKSARESAETGTGTGTRTREETPSNARLSTPPSSGTASKRADAASPSELLKGTTPGPWFWNEDHVLWGQNGHVVVLGEPASGFDPGDLDARLIAAAPELARRLSEAEALIKTQRLVLIGYEHKGENPSPEEASECECWYCQTHSEARLALKSAPIATHGGEQDDALRGQRTDEGDDRRGGLQVQGAPSHPERGLPHAGGSPNRRTRNHRVTASGDGGADKSPTDAKGEG